MNLGLCCCTKKKKNKREDRRDDAPHGSQTLADDLPRCKRTPDVQTHACETWRGAVRVIQRVSASSGSFTNCASSAREGRRRKGGREGRRDRCQLCRLRLPDHSVGKLRRICQIQARSLSRTLSHTPPRLSRNEDRMRSVSESRRGINPAQLS